MRGVVCKILFLSLPTNLFFARGIRGIEKYMQMQELTECAAEYPSEVRRLVFVSYLLVEEDEFEVEAGAEHEDVVEHLHLGDRARR